MMSSVAMVSLITACGHVEEHKAVREDTSLEILLLNYEGDLVDSRTALLITEAIIGRIYPTARVMTRSVTDRQTFWLCYFELENFSIDGLKGPKTVSISIRKADGSIFSIRFNEATLQSD